MTSRIRTRLTVILSALIAAVSLVGAQQTAPVADVRTVPLAAVVPVDPQITVGMLPNGLRYYIRVNKNPERRAELRLAVNAGSVLEDDDQRGLAHFVEHMSFNGTLHFPKLDVVNFMQAIGMRFGAHVNAHTSYDETVYELQIPTDNAAVVDRSFLIMEDWAHSVTFDPIEIEKERGVILEEWRLGLGADERIQNAQFPILLKGSRYAERLPIGTPEIIQNANPQRLKEFYQDWYRPDLMAVVAVGDFDRAAIEAEIRMHFAGLPRTLGAKTRTAYMVPDTPGTNYLVVTDPEATNTVLSVTSKMAARSQATISAYRVGMVERLFASMLNARLDEIAQAPNAPFLGAQTGRGLFVNAEEATNLDALVPPGGVERGLTALFTEVDRVARFGFTATELNREKLNVMRFFQGALVEKEQTPSPQLADEFVRNFMQAEPIPGITYEYGLNERFLPEITLAEVNALAKDWMPDRNRLVVLSAPEKDKATLPNEARIAADIKGATGGPLTAYVDTVSEQPLLPQLPMPGAITATTTNAAQGITEWRLSNGARVILKPTNFKQDEILFRAVSPGGTSLASDADYLPAATAAQVMGEGGLGNIKRLDLEKILAGSTASVRADIGPTEEGLGGGSTRKDLETMFQLVYLTFTAPRADPVAFGVLTDRLKIALANQESMPETVFNQAMQAALSQNNVRALPMTPERVPLMNLNKSLAFYKDRFADASDFIFVFVGSFDVNAMKPLVERYLASLPSLKRNDMVRDVGLHPPAGVVQRTVRAGIEPRSQVSIVFSGAFQNDELHRVIARSMGEMLSGNLQRTLREDLGGTYGVSVETSFTKLPTEEYRINISFACDPARTDVLTRAAFQVIEDFKNSGPSGGQVTDAKSALTRDLETFSRQNEYYLNRMLYKYEYGEDVNEVFNMPQIYAQLTAPIIRDAARAYLNPNRFVQVTLVPQTAGR